MDQEVRKRLTWVKSCPRSWDMRYRVSPLRHLTLIAGQTCSALFISLGMSNPPPQCLRRTIGDESRIVLCRTSDAYLVHFAMTPSSHMLMSSVKTGRFTFLFRHQCDLFLYPIRSLQESKSLFLTSDQFPQHVLFLRYYRWD
jgi:hypothetical protein